MLRLIGLGLRDGDVPLNGIEALRESDAAYTELYTNSIDYDLESLEEEAGIEIEEVDREEVEEDDRIVEEAGERDIAFLVSGDPLAATTHQDILFRARSEDIETEVVHAPSVFTAVAETGLSLYRFGRTTTLTEQNGKVPDSVWEAVEDNREEGLHTLLLLDIGMSASKAVELLEGAFEEVLVCSRLGTPDSETVRGEPGELEVEGFEDPSSVVVPAGFSPNEKKRLESVNK